MDQPFVLSPSLIYSLGIRCDAEISLRRLGLRRISSAVGSFDSRSISTIIHAVSTDFAWILDRSRFHKSAPSSRSTFIRGYLDSFSECNAIAQHHNLLDKETFLHFERAQSRFVKLSTSGISTLFLLSIKSADMTTLLVEDIRLLYNVLRSKFDCALLVQLYLKDGMTASSFLSRNGRTSPFVFSRLNDIHLDIPSGLHVTHELAAEDNGLFVSVCSSSDCRVELRKIQTMLLKSVLFDKFNLSAERLLSHEELTNMLGS